MQKFDIVLKVLYFHNFFMLCSKMCFMKMASLLVDLPLFLKTFNLYTSYRVFQTYKCPKFSAYYEIIFFHGH